MSDLKKIFSVALQALFLLAFLQPMFNLGLLTGIGYVIAIMSAVWTGVIFKQHIAWYILFGTLLSYFAGSFVPKIFTSYEGKDWTSFVIMLVITLLLWYKAYTLKEGHKRMW